MFFTKQVDNTKLSIPCEEIACKVTFMQFLYTNTYVCIMGCDIVFILWEAFYGYCEWESNLNMDFNV